jgi:hypothetical protein
MKKLSLPLALLTLLPALPHCASAPEHADRARRSFGDEPAFARRPWTDLPSSSFSPFTAANPVEEDEPRDLRVEPVEEEQPRAPLKMGMSRNEVRRIFGTPVEVEFAGDQRDGNFRWIYPLTTLRTLGDTKIVTFENGRVAGWETVRPD